MAYPHTTYGSYGDEKVTSTSKIGGLPLGARMELPDGRVFRHSKVGTTAVVAGKLYQGKDFEANTIFGGGAISLVPNAAPVGATTIKVTNAGTTTLSGVFDDGYLCVASSLGTGIGYTYKVKTNDAGAATSATGTIIVTLAENESVVVALNSSTKVRIRKSPYDGVLLTTTDTVRVNVLAGVSCATAAASTFIWLQRRGVASVFTDATTPIVGIPVVASSTVAGAIATPNLTGTAVNAVSVSMQALPVGICLAPCGTTDQFSTIDLTLE